jgi:hypothetical protein
MSFTKQQVSALRDEKVRSTMQDLAPVWLVSEEFRPREDAIVFNLVFQDPSYGWMNRRFKYDAFNDVLYHLGWRLLSEEETLDIQDAEPYISGELAVHVPNSPGFRTLGATSNIPR